CLNENITLNMQYLHSTAESRNQDHMDAAKPSSEGKPKLTANDSGTAAPKPAEGTAAPAAKRPEQMFVVQKSGPTPAGSAAPAIGPEAAAKNAFQSAITQGAGARLGAAQPTPANVQAPSGQPAGQPAGGQQPNMPAGGHPTAVHAARPQPAGGTAGVPAMATEAGLPELAEVEIRPDPLLSCLVILTRLFGN